MRTNRAELDEMLDSLQASLPEILAANPDAGDFWSEFAGHADAIEDSAAAADCEHIRGRIDAMLASHVLPAGENG